MERRAFKRRIDELSDKIDHFSNATEYLQGQDKTNFREKILNIKMKKHKLNMLTAYGEIQKNLIEMDKLKAENELQTEIDNFSKCFKSAKKMKTEIIEIEDDPEETLILDDIRHSTPIPPSITPPLSPHYISPPPLTPPFIPFSLISPPASPPSSIPDHLTFEPLIDFSEPIPDTGDEILVPNTEKSNFKNQLNNNSMRKSTHKDADKSALRLQKTVSKTAHIEKTKETHTSKSFQTAHNIIIEEHTERSKKAVAKTAHIKKINENHASKSSKTTGIEKSKKTVSKTGHIEKAKATDIKKINESHASKTSRTADIEISKKAEAKSAHIEKVVEKTANVEKIIENGSSKSSKTTNIVRSKKSQAKSAHIEKAVAAQPEKINASHASKSIKTADIERLKIADAKSAHIERKDKSNTNTAYSERHKSCNAQSANNAINKPEKSNAVSKSNSKISSKTDKNATKIATTKIPVLTAQIAKKKADNTKIVDVTALTSRNKAGTRKTVNNTANKKNKTDNNENTGQSAHSSRNSAENTKTTGVSAHYSRNNAENTKTAGQSAHSSRNTAKNDSAQTEKNKDQNIAKPENYESFKSNLKPTKSSNTHKDVRNLFKVYKEIYHTNEKDSPSIHDFNKMLKKPCKSLLVSLPLPIFSFFPNQNNSKET